MELVSEVVFVCDGTDTYEYQNRCCYFEGYQRSIFARLGLGTWGAVALGLALLLIWVFATIIMACMCAACKKPKDKKGTRPLSIHFWDSWIKAYKAKVPNNNKVPNKGRVPNNNKVPNRQRRNKKTLSVAYAGRTAALMCVVRMANIRVNVLAISAICSI